MRALLLFVAVCKLVSCGCPDGFELVRDGECRGFHSNATVRVEVSTKEAIARCDAINGNTVIIHNAEHQSYWKGKVPDSSKGMIILGIVCNTTKNEWEWSDGSTFDYKPPSGYYNNELDDPYCTEGYSWQLQPDGTWNYQFSGNVNGLFYCTTQLHQVPQGAHGCDLFADDAEDEACFQVGTAAETWQDANATCNAFGAELASIHNKQENDFIRRLAVSKGLAYGVFIGASAQKDGTFAWIDGTKMDYENYKPGYPKKNNGDCISMDTSSTTGQWMNVDCSRKLPVACIRAQQNVSAPVCTRKKYKEEAIITSPGFPFSAYTPCDYSLTVAAGKKIEVEIINLEANTCCDALKIYNGNVGAPLLADLSGEVRNQTYTSSSNSVRVSWKPNGGFNVKGLVFTYRAV